jgi:hypothetical protein
MQLVLFVKYQDLSITVTELKNNTQTVTFLSLKCSTSAQTEKQNEDSNMANMVTLRAQYSGL